MVSNELRQVLQSLPAEAATFICTLYPTEQTAHTSSEKYIQTDHSIQTPSDCGKRFETVPGLSGLTGNDLQY